MALGIGTILLIILLLFVRVPIAFAMIIGGVVYVGVDIGWTGSLSALSTTPYAVANTYTLAVIPMFIFIGEIADRAGYMEKIYAAVLLWLGQVRGAVVGATVIGAAIFGACSGSSLASAAVLSRVCYPEMIRHGVPKGFAAATIASSGTLAVLIPPSVTLVILGFLAETSVGQLLLAGVVPGILSAAIYFAMIFVRSKRSAVIPIPPASGLWQLRVRSLGALWPVIMLAVIILGSIYGGFATPTEAAAVGALVLVVVGIAGRRVSPIGVLRSAQAAATVTGALLLLMIGGMFMAKVVARSGISAEVQGIASATGISVEGFMLIVILAALVGGMFLDSLSVSVLLMPVLIPVVDHLGIDKIWFVILFAKMIEIGMITPPLGMNVFVVRNAVPDVPLGLLYRQVGWYLAMDILTLAILFMFPQLVLFLPNLL